MILVLKDGREFDTESEADMVKLARSLTAIEATVVVLKAQMNMLTDSLNKALSKPILVQAADLQPVVNAVSEMNANVKVGFEKMVDAQLADTVLVRDSEGEAQRAVKKVTRGEFE